MKCNYKNRNSEGDKGFQALESYTKSLMPASRRKNKIREVLPGSCSNLPKAVYCYYEWHLPEKRNDIILYRTHVIRKRMCAVLRFIQLIMTNIMKPITAIQIFYEPQVGTEQEVLRTFFSFVGCLVKTTRMSAEDMSKQHKILAHPENKQTAYLFLTDCYPGDSEPAENELWCAFSIKEQKLIINGADAIQGRSSVMRFEKEALNDIIRHVWRGDAMAVASLQHINETFWQFDMFAHLQIKSTFQVLKMSELKALSLKSDYKLPEDSFLNEMADSFIGLEKQSRVGPQSIYSVYAYVNAQRHLRELTAALETYTSLTIRLLSILEPVEKLLSELNKIYRVAPGFVPMYRLAAALCEGQPQFALDARPYLRDAIEHASKETMPFTAEIFLQYGLSEKQMYADCERALQCFQKALQLDDSSYKAMFQIACLDVADRKYQHAKAGFKKVIVSIQGNDANPDWSGMSLEEILYVYRSYVWLAKLVLVSDGEFAIGAPIAMALNAAVAFRQATILDACCDPENHQRVGRYHGSGIVLRAMFVLLRDMVGDAETNRELGEEIENNIKCYGIK